MEVLQIIFRVLFILFGPVITFFLGMGCGYTSDDQNQEDQSKSDNESRKIKSQNKTGRSEQVTHPDGNNKRIISVSLSATNQYRQVTENHYHDCCCCCKNQSVIESECHKFIPVDTECHINNGERDKERD